jgi:hypothetical protein
MVETKVKQLHTNVNGTDKKNSSEELIKREDIKDTPFQVIEIKDRKECFGVMGEYRVTQKYETTAEVKKDLKKMTWNRIVQVIMILGELKEKVETKKTNKK